MTHFIGTYLEVKLNKTYAFREHMLKCSNDHIVARKPIHFELSQIPFCYECGATVGKEEVSTFEYPNGVDDILDERWVDELGVITPPSLFRTDTMLLNSNVGDYHWLQLYGHNEECEIKPMPTVDEIEKMKSDFVTCHYDIIDELNSSEHVKGLSVKFGYVAIINY
jgi:hypothetical protein